MKPLHQAKTCTHCGFRHVVCALAFLGFTCNFIINVSFSIALVAMVNSPNPPEGKDESFNRTTTFNASLNRRMKYVNAISSSPELIEKFDWNTETQSFMLSALQYGTMSSVLLSGMLMQKLGIRWVFGIALLSCSILSLLTPLAARSLGATAIISIRFVQGITQGTLFPMQSHFIGYWMPVMERSRAFAFTVAGSYVGTIIAMFASGFLADSERGWPSIFIVFGALGCLCSVLWMILVSDYPDNHPCVSAQEIHVIKKDRYFNENKVTIVPWTQILLSLPLWSYIITVSAYGVVFSTLSNELPLYLNQILHFNIRKSGALSAAPFLTRLFVLYTGGFIADAMRKREILTISNIRKLMTALGFFGCAVFLIAISFAGTSTALITAFLCVSTGMTGFLSVGCLVSLVDLTPTFAVSAAGVAHTFGNLAGAVMPYVATSLTSSEQTPEAWAKVFNVCAAVAVLSGLQFLVFGSAELQPWDAKKRLENKGFGNSTIEVGEPVFAEF